MAGERLAAVDCGTNSTRLLVCDADGRTLDRRMRITRLGAGVDAAGRFDDQALERTFGVLREYREAMDEHGVGRVRAVATSAARDAANRDRLLDAATELVGARPEVLTGDEEGRLSFLGATAELDTEGGPYLVVDIGGGSTELAVGGRECEGVRTVDIGCVRVTERFLHHDPPLPEELSAAVAVCRDHLEEVARELPMTLEAETIVGLAGTVTTAAAVEMGLPRYDRDRIHHFTLTREAAEDVFRTLATEPVADRVHNPGLEPERADVIVGGMCVLVAVLRYFDAPGLLVSEADILDGLVASLR